MLVVPLAGGEVGIFFLLKSSCQRQGLHARHGAGKGGLHGEEPFYHPVGVVLLCGCVEPCGFGSWAPWSGLRRSVAAPQCVGLVALCHAAQRALVLRAGLRFRRPCLDSRVGAHRHRVAICRSGDSLPFPVVFVGGSALGLSSYEFHLQAVAVTQYCALGFASLRPRGDVARGEVELALFGQLMRARVIADLSQQVTATSATGWNPVDGSAVSHEATQITHSGPGSGRSGLSWLDEAFGARQEHIGHLAVSSDAEAQAVATAALDQRARRFVRIEGLSEGNPAIRVGTTVSVSGLSPQFDNRYFVCAASHVYDQTAGYRTEFSGECAFLGEGT